MLALSLLLLGALPGCPGPATQGGGACSVDSDCDVAHATGTCQSGQCAVTHCDTGYGDCDHLPSNGCEVALDGDAKNCGACGSACAAPATCSAGACSSSKGDAGIRDSGLADTAVADLSHRMDFSAPPDLATPDMAAPDAATVDAAGLPVDLSGTDADAAEDLAASVDLSDLAVAPDLADLSDFSVAPDLTLVCLGGCALANSDSVCAGGMCVIVDCASGWADCDQVAGNGCETNVTSDSNNCNGCGAACPSGPNGTAICSTSQCALICDPGYGDCDADPTDGCEVSTDGDLANCGACGMACVTPNGTSACVSGQCAGAGCDTGYADCNGLLADGCEVSTDGDASNCGVCGMACVTPNGTSGCASGQCTVAGCSAGYADCDVNPVDGCEVSTDMDPSNCGACGTLCVAPNGTSGCASAQCAVTICNAGYADCDLAPSNGCEVHTDADVTNCGACGNLCLVAHGTAACASGQCAVGSCDTGYADCNGDPTDGCEVTVGTDANNCSACGDACTAPAGGNVSCVSGACVGTCPGSTLCGAGTGGGGTCTTLDDPANCGACGVICPSGTCGSAVFADFTTSPTSWTFNGSAYYDSTAKSGVLTAAGGTNQAGTIVYQHAIATDQTVDVVFDFRISGSTGGEGMGVMMEKNGPTAVGQALGGLGMSGLIGYGVELDTFNDNDCSDSSGNHGGVDNLGICDTPLGTPTSLAQSGDLTSQGLTLSDGSWHNALAQLYAGKLTLVIDNKIIFSNVALPGYVAGDPYYFGFAGSTSSLTERAEIRNVEILLSSAHCL